MAGSWMKSIQVLLRLYGTLKASSDISSQLRLAIVFSNKFLSGISCSSRSVCVPAPK